MESTHLLGNGIHFKCVICSHKWFRQVDYNLYNYPIDKLATFLMTIECPYCKRDKGVVRLIGHNE